MPAVDINSELSLEFIYQHVFVFSSLTTMLTVKHINYARLGIHVNARGSGEALIPRFTVAPPAPSRCGLADHLQRRTMLAIQSTRSHHHYRRSTHPTPPSNPHKSDLIRQLVQCGSE